MEELDETPTPPPVEVAFGGYPPPSSRRPRGPLFGAITRVPGRLLFVAAFLAAVAVLFTQRALDGAVLLDNAHSLFSFADRAKTDATGRASILETLIFGAGARPSMQTPEAAEREPADTRDDATAEVPIRRDGHVSIPGGILVFPESFRPHSDGSYDLLIHFHGNTAVVKESTEVSKLDAAVAIVNLGIGSQVYEEYYTVGGTYEELLDAIQAGVKQRGLKNAKLHRVALSSWSAGYGAISSILVSRKGRDDLDAVPVLDGIHGSWDEGHLNAAQMRPFTQLAQRAAAGQIYFGITHSEIDPLAYAGSTATADYLIASVGATRQPLDAVRDAPPYLSLESMKGAVSKQREKKMEPTGEARIGTFHVTGYRGDLKEHHMAHLFQMGATLLPELVQRWSVGR